jgi:hypothetical protein
MGKSRAKPKASKRQSPKQAPEAVETEIVIPIPHQSLEALEEDGPVREPSAEELQELEASVRREEARERLLGLARDYPRSDRPLVKPLTDALKAVPGLRAVHARVVAQSLKQIADNAHDLSEIVNRILQEKHDPGEVAELVMAFQIVTEQLASYAELLEDKLYEVFDRAKRLK